MLVKNCVVSRQTPKRTTVGNLLEYDTERENMTAYLERDDSQGHHAEPEH